MSIWFSPRTVEQRPPERVSYTTDAAIYGGSPSSVACTLYQVNVDRTLTDVSATRLSGAASVAGDVITTPLVVGLTAGATYLLEVKFVSGGNTWAPLLQVQGVA